MIDTLKTIPELFESYIGESLKIRDQNLTNYKDLGPPDLIQIIKSSTKSQGKEVKTILIV